MKQPMVDIAFDLMQKKKKEIAFPKLWEEVTQIKGLTQSQADDLIADFYTDMSLDDRFMILKDNKWDLRSRRKFAEFVVDTDAIMVEDEDVEEIHVVEKE